MGADRLASGYVRAKTTQEDLVRRSALPYSRVRATPFVESVESAVCAGGVYVAPLLRPIGWRRRRPLAHVAATVPLFGVLEAGVPEERPFEDLVVDGLTARDCATPVIGDA
ncbi:hypothetical protein [Streptomyces avermitilis]|uniref:hypothetical protein n=1 Tax=Streptomyces avermitilis TaxID=33903 RepID=UPI00382EA949